MDADELMEDWKKLRLTEEEERRELNSTRIWIPWFRVRWHIV